MRPISVSACLVVAVLASGQPAAPNAVKLTKYILGVADLDRSYAFYHALGMEFENANGAIGKPAVLPEMLLKLVDVPAGTKFRNMMLKIPGAAFSLEATEFSGMELHPVKPRIQDPGAAMLAIGVDNLDAALQTAKKNGAVVVTTGGAPVAGRNGAGRVVTVKDPDGYYLELQQVGVPSGSGKVVSAAFAFVVKDSEEAASFYKDSFGFGVTLNRWTSAYANEYGIPSSQIRAIDATIPGTEIPWGFLEFKGVDRKPYTPRIPDPGAAAIGLQVRDIDVAIAAVKVAGGSSVTEGGSLKLGNGRVGFVRDPSGILVELAQ